MKVSSQSSSWSSSGKTLVLGACIGYLVAVLSASPSVGFPSALVRRVLEEAEGAGEEEAYSVTMDGTVTTIVMILITMTIAFETVKEYIEESADRNLKPIIESLFGEMTILGFLSVFTFCITKLGIFRRISVQLFGKEEEEELLEIFEFVHYMLFFVMVFFVTTVLALVAGAKSTEKKWWIMNRACRDEEYMQRLDELEETDASPGVSWFSYLCGSLTPLCRDKSAQYRTELRVFRSLRNEFLLDRALEPPFAPSGSDKVDPDFDFGNYLGVCLGHELAHIVHVNLATWLFFAMLTLVFCAVDLVLIEHGESVFAWVWAATGFVLFLVGNFFDYHILRVLMGLGAPAVSARDSSENTALLSNSLPAWTQIDLDTFKQNRNWFSRYFGGHWVRSRQDTLYWLGRRGPKIYMVVFQVQLVFTAAYSSLLLLTFVEQMFAKSSTFEATAFTVVSVLPIAGVIAKFQPAAANMAMACNLGVHQRPHVVAEVVRFDKVNRVIRAMVLMFKLEQRANGGIHHHHSESNRMSPHAVELVDAAKSFDALDSDGDGTIDNSELETILTALGASTTRSSLDRMLAVLDKDGDGRVNKSEFLEFYSETILTDASELHELAHDLYHKFDHDGSGKITLSEFKKVLGAFNVQFSVDDVGQLVNELDEHNDGQVGEHEFHELLRKHSYLFQPPQVPPLE